MKRPSSFSRNLIAWYLKNKRDLPWRTTRDPYKIWISEIMLQQTTVNAVIPYYQSWIRNFPDVFSVARASSSRILKSWQGLGYYDRARNIHKTARIIAERYQGVFPNTFDQLKKLPGFGPYTTGAVLSIAFDKRYPIVDANIRRVIMRQLGVKGHADTSQDRKIITFLENVMPQKHMSDFNQGLMELGAMVCRSKEILCAQCPIQQTCTAYKEGAQEIIPFLKNRKITPIVASVAVIWNKNKVLIQKRSSKGLLAGLWEFPGGKVEKKETPGSAIEREIKEELKTCVTQKKFLFKTKHFYTRFCVDLHVFECILDSSPELTKSRKWVSLNAIKKYPMPSGSAKILDHITLKGKNNEYFAN